MKYIVCIDVETTGLSSDKDHIIQLSAAKLDKETMEEVGRFNRYILPSEPFEISPKAEEVHHITKEYLLKHGVRLRDIAQELIDFLDDSDYLTYNGNTFDFKFLYKELARAGYELPRAGRVFYDSYAIECKLSSRDLSTIYSKYTGKTLEGAHDSMNDVEATIEVFKGQLKALNMGLDDISDWRENNLLDINGMIRNASTSGEPIYVFNNGKYKDCDVFDILSRDPSYIRWWASATDDYTKGIIGNYLRTRQNS